MAATVETANPQMLFDPFEEQFDLPTLAVEFGDHRRGHVKLVGQ